MKQASALLALITALTLFPAAPKQAYAQEIWPNNKLLALARAAPTPQKARQYLLMAADRENLEAHILLALIAPNPDQTRRWAQYFFEHPAAWAQKEQLLTRYLPTGPIGQGTARQYRVIFPGRTPHAHWYCQIDLTPSATKGQPTLSSLSCHAD